MTKINNTEIEIQKKEKATLKRTLREFALENIEFELFKYSEGEFPNLIIKHKLEKAILEKIMGLDFLVQNERKLLFYELPNCFINDFNDNTHSILSNFFVISLLDICKKKESFDAVSKEEITKNLSDVLLLLCKENIDLETKIKIVSIIDNDLRTKIKKEFKRKKYIKYKDYIISELINYGIILFEKDKIKFTPEVIYWFWSKRQKRNYYLV
ncbi:MAG: hypothetical protein WC872_02030 [Candidatus Absconditabacterales bacterium]|jgi:hypothetical protein